MLSTLKCAKFCVGPTSSSPGPILLNVAATAVKFVVRSLPSNETRKTVYAGPTEATAIGNIASQMIADGKLKDLKDARRCIFDSFEIKEYNPDL